VGVVAVKCDCHWKVNTVDSVNTYNWKEQRLQSAELSTLIPNRTLHPRTGSDNCIASNHLIPPLQNHQGNSIYFGRSRWHLATSSVSSPHQRAPFSSVTSYIVCPIQHDVPALLQLEIITTNCDVFLFFTITNDYQVNITLARCILFLLEICIRILNYSIGYFRYFYILIDVTCKNFLAVCAWMLGYKNTWRWLWDATAETCSVYKVRYKK
jgi:hypothetical protein